MEKAIENLKQKGFLDIKIPKGIDIVAEIKRLKKEKNAIILAHYYQVPEIQAIADYVGDSLGLSQKAAETDAEIIVFAGVHFMAETAKIVNPSKKVLLPDLLAGCSLAESMPAEEFKPYKEAHPDHVVVTYINCTAEIKALSDIVCTSSNAEQIVASIPKDTPIIFAPDRNLGAYIQKKTGRKMLLWDGSCVVHEEFSKEKIEAIEKKHPDAKFIAHPESEMQILDKADYIGSTSGLIKYVKENNAKKFIVATEAGILYKMKQEAPDKILIAAPIYNNVQCACSECPYMKLNSLEKLYNCIKYELPEVTVDENIMDRALLPITRMLDVSKKASNISFFKD